MKKLLAIGEALIDLIPEETGRALKDVIGFRPAVGGAPANVCGAYSRLGGPSEMITQLGMDPFGDKIIEEFDRYHIGRDYVSRTAEANTSLAFVALKEDGNREFSFYRKPGADMLMSPDRIRREWFEDAFALHFCSVSIGDFSMKEAHKRAICYAEETGTLISFDPNLRFALWPSNEELKTAVDEFLPKANILKISDEELEFLTGKTEIEDALPQLMQGNVRLVIYTKGSKGAQAFTASTKAKAASRKVKAIDTTGAGDAFIGSFLFQLSKDGVSADTLSELSADQLTRYLDFSNRYCGLSVQRNGAIMSYPTLDEMIGEMS
ncbi:MAG TPA: carbohydrate kinase [Candidatus Onthocola gallistercoris]|uniref:Carbohydrate kinase n=1 Tax=Candidatus Onthocola gallistercoris TaxID=2840876 RepID=A0A9D1HGS9_9FIRM|nr:carbohydrate kinase [Candidatus Onthocola gallistercoris]